MGGTPVRSTQVGKGLWKGSIPSPAVVKPGARTPHVLPVAWQGSCTLRCGGDGVGSFCPPGMCPHKLLTRAVTAACQGFKISLADTAGLEINRAVGYSACSSH